MQHHAAPCSAVQRCNPHDKLHHAHGEAAQEALHPANLQIRVMPGVSPEGGGQAGGRVGGQAGGWAGPHTTIATSEPPSHLDRQVQVLFIFAQGALLAIVGGHGAHLADRLLRHRPCLQHGTPQHPLASGRMVVVLQHPPVNGSCDAACTWQADTTASPPCLPHHSMQDGGRPAMSRPCPGSLGMGACCFMTLACHMPRVRPKHGAGCPGAGGVQTVRQRARGRTAVYESCALLVSMVVSLDSSRAVPARKGRQATMTCRQGRGKRCGQGTGSGSRQLACAPP